MMLKNKIALITGATGVIGQTIARVFAEEGCDLVITGRSAADLEKSKSTLSSNCRVETCPADIGNEQSVQNLFNCLSQKFDHLDIVVSAAGTYGEIGLVKDCDGERWLETFRTNVLGTMLGIKYALPLLKKSGGGRIITFAGGGEKALPRFTAYAASKGAIIRFTESVAAELVSEAILVNAISPGLVKSGLQEEIIEAGIDRVGTDAYRSAQEQIAGDGSAVSPEKAAALALFLVSDKAAGLTGKNISAVWDKYEDIPEHLADIMSSDVYNWRRIKPKDRGYDW